MTELDTMPPATAATYAPTIASLESPAENRAPWSNPQDLYSLVPYPEDYWTRAVERRCFGTDEANFQVTWTEVNSENHATVNSVGSWAKLRECASDSNNPGTVLRVISVNQRNSWRPLKVTRQVLQEIINIAGASSEILEYPLAFGQKNLGIEEAFSSAPVFKSNDHSIELGYVMKYASKKKVEEQMDPWVIRQTGVYQKYDTQTNQATWIFFHPTTDCDFQKRLAELLKSPDHVLAFRRQPLLIHNILLGTFFPLWRDYLAHYEQKILQIGNISMAQRIEEQLRVNHETLGSVRHTENRCLSLRPIFGSLEKLFRLLSQVNGALAERSITPQPDIHAMQQLLNNYSNMVDAYSQQAWFIQSRTARLANSITDTLSFKDSNTSKDQSQYMLDLTLSTVDDSTTVRVITIVTLIYLPSTFMAALLGMNSFFEMDPDNHNLVVSPQFWIYVVCSVPLTVATLLYWWFSQRSRQRMKLECKEGILERGSMYD